MIHDARRGCVFCAWRGTCAKQFSIGDAALQCPDFTEDVQLRRELNQTDPADEPKDYP